MSDPSLEVQKAIVAALKANGALPPEVGGRVYDPVPANAKMPYVSIGPIQVLPDKADCIDGAELSIQIDVWSTRTDGQEAKVIAKAVVAKLDDKPLAVDDHDAIVFEHEVTRHLTDPDGQTKHSAITFRALVQPL